MPNKAVEVSDLFFCYDKNVILENVNVSIRSGEFIGIFGPNGGGKTTFLKLLMGFLKPMKGKIAFFDEKPLDARKKIGYVPQITRLDKTFPITVLEVVLMGRLARTNWLGYHTALSKEKALYMLEKVKLHDKKDEPFGTLSGGQAQRALIARALVSEPQLLFLDEPTASIDPKAEEDILQILSELKGKITILMVTHDLQTIVRSVERLLCIHRHVHSFQPSEVCEHFGLGLYHSPLLQNPFDRK